MSRDYEQDTPGRRTILLGTLLLIGVIVAWLISNEVDRQSRTETIDGIQPYGALHLAGDSIILTEFEGRVISYDIVGRQSTILLDGLLEPVAADVGGDGTTCAVSQGTGSARSAWLTCTNGMRVDLSAFDVPSLDVQADASVASLSDVISDGDTGWIIADAGRMALLHVDNGGSVEVVTRFRPITGYRYAPQGLSRTDDRVTVALGGGGITTVAVTDRDQVTVGGSYVDGEDSVAVAPSGGASPLVLVHSLSSSNDFVTYPVGGADAIHAQIVDHLDRATGLVFLGGERLAIATNRRLILVRPTDLPR